MGRIRRMIKARIGRLRLSSTAPIFMAAVLEYLTTEILEVSGQALIQSQQNRKHKTERITKKYVPMAVYRDSELATAFREFVFEDAPPPQEAVRIFQTLLVEHKARGKAKKRT